MRATTQPSIKMTEADMEGLWSLAKSNFRGNPELTSFLVDEIARATLVEPERTRNVVTMNSWVEFYYGLANQILKVQLVYPAEADITKGKMSVMTPIGAALIGLSEGQRMEWRTWGGSKQNLMVLKVDHSSSQK